MLDGGDLVQGSPVSTLYRGLPVFELANLLGLSVSTLGNHEFDYGWERIPEFLKTADFPVVTANVVDADGRKLVDGPWTVLNANGVRVGVIGLLTTNLPNLTTPENIGPWRVLSVVETVKRYLPELQRSCDLIVVLGHLEDEEEVAVLTEIPEVAAVIAGHGHAGLEHPIVIGGRPLVRVKAFGRQLGRLDLSVDVKRKILVGWRWNAIEIMAAEFPADAKVASRVEHWEAKVAEQVDVPIGKSTRELQLHEVRSLVEHAMKDKTGADLAIVNRGGIRDGLPQGPLLARHVWNIMPFDNRIVIGEFKGSELPGQVRKERGLDPEKTYRLATMDFVAVNWKVRGLGDLSFPETGPLVRDAVIDWIRQQKVVDFDALAAGGE